MGTSVPSSKSRSSKAESGKDDAKDVASEREKGSSSSRLSARPGGIKGTSVLWGIVIIGLLGGALYATFPVWGHNWLEALNEWFPFLEDEISEPISPEREESRKAGDAGSDSSVLNDLIQERAALKKELADVLERVSGLEEQLSSTQQIVTSTSTLSSQRENGEDTSPGQDISVMAELQNRIERLEQQIHSQNDMETTGFSDELEKRLQALEEQNAYFEHRRRLLRTTTELRTALTSGESYQPFLTQLKKEFDKTPPQNEALDQAIATLDVYDETGIDSWDTLRSDFDLILREVLSADREHGDNSGEEAWFSEAVDRLSRLIKVHRTDEIQADNAQAVLLAVREHLDNRDLNTAVEALKSFDFPQGQAQKVSSWLERATARIKAETAVGVLYTHVATPLSFLR